MNSTNAAVHAMDMLREHEQTLGRLYATYARRFPQDADFWMGLSDEERQHAEWLEALQARTEDDPSSLIVERFPAAAIAHSIAYLNRLIAGADRPDITPLNALSTALDLEQALLENRYFEVFISDSPAIRRTLELLAAGTRSHLERVRRTWRDSTQMPQN